MNRREFLQRAALSGVGGAAALGGYAGGVELHWAEFVERDLPVAALPPALAGARRVQISDLHVGRLPRLGPRRAHARRAVPAAIPAPAGGGCT